MATNNDDGNGAVRAVTVFASLSQPMLKSVDPVTVSTIIRERDSYEHDVVDKRAELST